MYNDDDLKDRFEAALCMVGEWHGLVCDGVSNRAGSRCMSLRVVMLGG